MNKRTSCRLLIKTSVSIIFEMKFLKPVSKKVGLIDFSIINILLLLFKNDQGGLDRFLNNKYYTLII